MLEVLEKPKTKFLRADVWAWRNKLEVGQYVALLNTVPFNKNLAYNVPRRIEYRSSTSFEIESLSKAGVGQWIDLPSLKTLIAQTEDTFTIVHEGVHHTYQFIPSQT